MFFRLLEKMAGGSNSPKKKSTNSSTLPSQKWKPISSESVDSGSSDDESSNPKIVKTIFSAVCKEVEHELKRRGSDRRSRSRSRSRSRDYRRSRPSSDRKRQSRSRSRKYSDRRRRRSSPSTSRSSSSRSR